LNPENDLTKERLNGLIQEIALTAYGEIMLNLKLDSEN
jgi:hypothetical protein